LGEIFDIKNLIIPHCDHQRRSRDNLGLERMGKRKVRGSQHHHGNQTSGDDFHVRKYMKFQSQPKAI
jgi:hypothetical protein